MGCSDGATVNGGDGWVLLGGISEGEESGSRCASRGVQEGLIAAIRAVSELALPVTLLPSSLLSVSALTAPRFLRRPKD